MANPLSVRMISMLQSTLNLFYSDNESDHNQAQTSSKRTSSEPIMSIPNLGTNLFGDDVKGTSYTVSTRTKYKFDFRDSGGFENQSVQELESYVVHKSEETTRAVHGALKIVEEIREDSIKTLVTLHQQGEQITRTHDVVVDIDHDFTRVEKTKQDDALSGLSNTIGELKEMAMDMSWELDGQIKALEPLDDDMEKIGQRLKGANMQARRLLGK